jgi:predicted ATP-grasp superfamily ATP-dependent carboligase
VILLWGIEDDSPLAAVRDAVCRLGVTMAWLDQHVVLETAVDLCAGAAVAGVVRTGSRTIDLGAVTAAYLRPSDLPRLRPLARAGSGSRSWRHAVAVTDALWSWAELTPALVVNRPTAMAGNHSKPYQAHQIRSCGFETPETLITTDAREALAFRQRHQTVIYKSISGVRSIVARLTPQHLERLDDLAWCPTQFQRYVPGTDYRVHVVGEDVFACEVISQADDYRYAGRQGATVQFRPCDLAGELSSRCRSLVARLGLTVAGVDLRRSTDGTWYCFEVNPSPGFTYYEAATGQPIADAIARLLAAGSSAERAGAVDTAA